MICGFCGNPGHAANSCYKWNVWRATHDSQSKGKTGKGESSGGKSKVMRNLLVCSCALLCSICFVSEKEARTVALRLPTRQQQRKLSSRSIVSIAAKRAIRWQTVQIQRKI